MKRAAIGTDAARPGRMRMVLFLGAMLLLSGLVVLSPDLQRSPEGESDFDRGL